MKFQLEHLCLRLKNGDRWAARFCLKRLGASQESQLWLDRSDGPTFETKAEAMERNRLLARHLAARNPGMEVFESLASR